MKTNLELFLMTNNVLHDKGTAASKEFLIHLSQDSNFLLLLTTHHKKVSQKVFERLDLTCQENDYFWDAFYVNYVNCIEVSFTPGIIHP